MPGRVLGFCKFDPYNLKALDLAVKIQPTASTMATTTVTNIDNRLFFEDVDDQDGQFLARVSLYSGAPRLSQANLPFIQSRRAVQLGSHAIVGIWEQGLEPELSPVLLEMVEKPTFLMAFRIGFSNSDPSDCPVTIAIGVEPQSLERHKAKQILGATLVPYLQVSAFIIIRL